MSNKIRDMMAIIVTMIVTWLINTVYFVQTVVAEDFIWAEIGTMTIIQGCAIVIWPLTLVTGPISIFL